MMDPPSRSSSQAADRRPQQQQQQQQHQTSSPPQAANSMVKEEPPVPKEYTNNRSPPSNSSSAHPSQTIQKRRRVTRACDECRRKKIKCDGKQPCTHCTVYSYECTYDKPSNRRRNPSPHYVQELESKAQRAETIAKALLPGIDIYNSNFNLDAFLRQVSAETVSRPPSTINSPASEPGWVSRVSSSSALAAQGVGPSNLNPQQSGRRKSRQDKGSGEEDDGANDIESMIDSTGRLQLDENGALNFVGTSSVQGFLKRLAVHLHTDNLDLYSKPRSLEAIKKESYFSPHQHTLSPESDSEDRVQLPSKQVFYELLNSTNQKVMVVNRFVHIPTFYKNVESVYATDPDLYTSQQMTFLPVLYATLALTMTFSVDQARELGFDRNHPYRYFAAAKRLTNLIDSRDVFALQTLLMMITFLQSSARLSTCYAYIGVALRGAIRMGYHRHITDRFNPIQMEERKRIFWSIRKMDIYVSAMLGLPTGMDDESYVNQPLPAEVDDEYINENGIGQQPSGVVSAVAAVNAHTKLHLILDRIVKKIYIPQSKAAAETNNTIPHKISYSKVMMMEAELQKWVDSLPPELSPNFEPPEKYRLAQRILHMTLCHVKLALYRPFVHYVSSRIQPGRVDSRAFSCAANCINTSRTVIYIADDLKRSGLLSEGYWFSIYTIFNAVALLVYYIHENLTNPSVGAVRKDVETGLQVVGSLKDKTTAAFKSYTQIEALLKELDELMVKERASRNQKASATPSGQAEGDEEDEAKRQHPRKRQLSLVTMANDFSETGPTFDSSGAQILSGLGTISDNYFSAYEDSPFGADLNNNEMSVDSYGPPQGSQAGNISTLQGNDGGIFRADQFPSSSGAGANILKNLPPLPYPSTIQSSALANFDASGMPGMRQQSDYDSTPEAQQDSGNTFSPKGGQIASASTYAPAILTFDGSASTANSPPSATVSSTNIAFPPTPSGSHPFSGDRANNSNVTSSIFETPGFVPGSFSSDKKPNQMSDFMDHNGVKSSIFMQQPEFFGGENRSSNQDETRQPRSHPLQLQQQPQQHRFDAKNRMPSSVDLQRQPLPELYGLDGNRVQDISYDDFDNYFNQL